MAKKKEKQKNRGPKSPGGLPTEKREPLTLRETEVVFLIARDLDNRAIGETLGISIETVKEHVQNSLRKLKLRSRVGLAVWFIKPPVAQ